MQDYTYEWGAQIVSKYMQSNRGACQVLAQIKGITMEMLKQQLITALIMNKGRGFNLFKRTLANVIKGREELIDRKDLSTPENRTIAAISR